MEAECANMVTIIGMEYIPPPSSALLTRKSCHDLVKGKIELWDGDTGGGNDLDCGGCVGGGRSGDDDGVGHEESLFFSPSSMSFRASKIEKESKTKRVCVSETPLYKRSSSSGSFTSRPAIADLI